MARRQILDDGKLRALKASPSGRKVHTVSGSFKKTYFCVRDYCSCESYFQLARKPTAGRVMVRASSIDLRRTPSPNQFACD